MQTFQVFSMPGRKHWGDYILVTDLEEIAARQGHTCFLMFSLSWLSMPHEGEYGRYLLTQRDINRIFGAAPEYAVVSSCTCGRDGVIRAHKSNVHCQKSPSHIVDGEGYAKRIHLLESLHTSNPMILGIDNAS